MSINCVCCQLKQMKQLQCSTTPYCSIIGREHWLHHCWAGQVVLRLSHYQSHRLITSSQLVVFKREFNYSSLFQFPKIWKVGFSLTRIFLFFFFFLSDWEQMKFHCLCIYSLTVMWSGDYWLYKVIQADSIAWNVNTGSDWARVSVNVQLVSSLSFVAR